MIQISPAAATEFFGVPQLQGRIPHKAGKTLNLLDWKEVEPASPDALSLNRVKDKEALIDLDSIQPERLEQFNLGFSHHVPYYFWLHQSLTSDFTKKHLDVYLLWRQLGVGGQQQYFILFRYKKDRK